MKSISKAIVTAATFLFAAGAFFVGAQEDAFADGYPEVTAVEQTEATKNSITVSWTGEYFNSYEVYYNDYYGDSTEKLYTSLESSTTSCTIKGLKAGTVYSVKVVGIGDEYENYSRIEAVTLVDKVKGLEQDTWYHWIETASVKWDRYTAADEYEYIIKNGKGKKVKSGKESWGDLSFDVKNNQVFTFQVRAIQKYNGKTVTGAWTTIKVFEQPWIIKGKLDKKVLNIKWEKQTGATGYDIYVSTDNKKYKKVKSVGKKTTSAKIKKFKNKKLKKKKYYVYVVSKTKLDGKTCKSGKVYSFEVTKNGFTDTYIKQ